MTPMARCPFAVWLPLPGSSGPYVGGHPFKIIHHTTEGSTADGAIETYKQTKNIPHFTVDDMTVYQHADTDVAVSALRHPAGTTETNRSSAIQIELVGFAGQPKNRASLKNVARLCRWIEGTHNVPQDWPNGHPNPPVNGQDPGGHNRDQNHWDTRGGHYGHCHVPNNTHWDPAYTEDETAAVMEAAAPADVAPPGGPAVMADHPASGPDAPRSVDQAGLDLIKNFEGLRLHAFQDPAGIWTIGYGHTAGVHAGMTITAQQATDLLIQDLTDAADFVDTAVAGILTGQNQFAAMTSLCYNIGSGNFKNSSVLRFHRAQDTGAAADAFLLWDKAHIDGQLVVLEGLLRRRQAEKDLYLTPDA
jgi:GH24 family phage-related lysozyme (muramidase)